MRRETRSRLGHLECVVAGHVSPVEIHKAACHRVSEGQFLLGTSERVRVAAIVHLVFALDDGWDPRREAVPMPEPNAPIDYLGVDGGEDPAPIASPELLAMLLGEGSELGIDWAFL